MEDEGEGAAVPAVAVIVEDMNGKSMGCVCVSRNVNDVRIRREIKERWLWGNEDRHHKVVSY